MKIRKFSSFHSCWCNRDASAIPKRPSLFLKIFFPEHLIGFKLFSEIKKIFQIFQMELLLNYLFHDADVTPKIVVKMNN